MPKYRKFHTKAVESLDINDMPDDFTRLMWVMLPLVLCAEGRGLDRPDWLKAKVFPLRFDVTEQMIAGAMDWYESRSMIRRYEVGGRGYFCLVNWHKYQGDTSREADSIYPAPPPVLVLSGSRVDQEPVTRQSRPQGDAQGDAQEDAQGEADAEQQDPPSPSPPNGYSSKNPPPAVKVWGDLTNSSCPNWKIALEMHNAVGLDPPNLKKWADVINAWLKRGYNGRNIDGLLDWYRDGIPKGHSNGNGRTEHKTVPRPEITGWEDCIVPGEQLPGRTDGL